MRPNLCAFISGHGDVTQEEFNLHYKPLIDQAIEDEVKEFVVGDFRGTDHLAQIYLKLRSTLNTSRDIKVTVYHMFDKPRNNPCNFPTIGGFVDDEERDTAMTLASTRDIAWIRPGKVNSGTEKNIKRREDEPCQLRREPFFQCCCTCIYLKPIHYHCCTEPKPSQEEKEGHGVEGRCVCGVQKVEVGGNQFNWACACPEMGVIHDNWGQHSCGCEFHTTKEENDKWEAQKKSDRKELEAFRAAAKVKQ